jgi:predicted nucleic acid-binding protein
VGKKQQAFYQVKVIVDANIAFSAILNTNGKIGDLLINSQKYFEFIAPNFLRTEIRKHHGKLSKISGLTLEKIRETEYQIYQDITFISEEQIKSSTWISAAKLVDDIDPKDTPYVAFSKHFKCKIWSGDKVLIKGLAKKGFTNFVTTDDLFRLREGA